MVELEQRAGLEIRDRRRVEVGVEVGGIVAGSPGAALPGRAAPGRGVLAREVPRVAVRVDVAEYFDERVLNRFVGLSGIAQVLIRDPQGPTLLRGNEASESLARLFGLASRNELPDLDCQARIVRQGRRRVARCGPSRDPGWR